MKTILFALLLAVPVFAQDSLSTDEVHRGPQALNVKTCTLSDIRNNPDQFTGYQIFDDASLLRIDPYFDHDWQATLRDDRNDDFLEVTCAPELAKQLKAISRDLRRYGRRWHVIVGETTQIVQLELFDKDGYFVRAYN